MTWCCFQAVMRRGSPLKRVEREKEATDSDVQSPSSRVDPLGGFRMNPKGSVSLLPPSLPPSSPSLSPPLSLFVRLFLLLLSA